MTTRKSAGCRCPYKKNGAVSAEACKNCNLKSDPGIKRCLDCGAEYAAEYEYCPSCISHQL